jgi:hypothetical protein
MRQQGLRMKRGEEVSVWRYAPPMDQLYPLTHQPQSACRFFFEQAINHDDNQRERARKLCY